MQRVAYVGLASLCLTGCTVTRLDLPTEPVRMTIVQRHAKPIPGSKNMVGVRIGDITGGQVLLTVDRMCRKAIVDTVSVQTGDVIPFRLGENQYYLKVIELRNLLIGDDFGVFDISSTPPAVGAAEKP